MSAFMAPEAVQRASRKPTTIRTTPPLWFSIARFRLSPRSEIASSGTMPSSRFSIDSIVSGPATWVNTPTATRRTAGIARKA